MSQEIKPKEMDNIKLSNGFVCSGIEIGTVKALVDHSDLDSLIGQLMQHIEATYQDKEQREAQKNIVKRLCREWLVHIYEWQEGWEVSLNVNPKHSKELTSKYIIEK